MPFLVWDTFRLSHMTCKPDSRHPDQWKVNEFILLYWRLEHVQHENSDTDCSAWFHCRERSSKDLIKYSLMCLSIYLSVYISLSLYCFHFFAFSLCVWHYSMFLNLPIAKFTQADWSSRKPEFLHHAVHCWRSRCSALAERRRVWGCLSLYWLQTTVCHHGLSSSMCVWIKDFLFNCWQAVRLGSHSSNSLTCQRQGTSGLRPRPLLLLPIQIRLAEGCLPGRGSCIPEHALFWHQ